MVFLEDLKFKNNFIEALPGDTGGANLPRHTPNVLYSSVLPTPVTKPEVLIWSPEAGEMLGLSVSEKPDDSTAEVFSGNKILPAMRPYSTRYGGYQFGHWASQLGDGRAISLGEVSVVPEKNSFGAKFLELQLKGAGLTPYSRNGDGRAVLRSSLREFLCSEAMFYLGVPTTRALTCVLTGDQVLRDMFYNGHAKLEEGAITTRVAPTFLRFGHFEILAAEQESVLLKKLADHVIAMYYPHFINSQNKYADFYAEVCTRTARLMVHWQRVGFVHGVMNTDNMSILGLTIDYGPYGWLDVFDPDWTPNTTDRHSRRYRFGDQPAVALWNLVRLAEALAGLTDKIEDFSRGIELYQTTFENEYRQMRANKLGLKDLSDNERQVLVTELDELLRVQETDPTIFYRRLSDLHLLPQDEPLTIEKLFTIIGSAFYQEAIADDLKDKLFLWAKTYLGIVQAAKVAAPEVRELMQKVNPAFILRNYLVQEAIDGLQEGSALRMNEIFAALKTPYEENQATQKFLGRRPEWARQRAGCSDLSCSS